MGWIYIFVNILNGKVYIGKWCGSKVETRRDQHKQGHGSQHLHNAIQRYGWDNFIFDTLHYAPKEQLADLEKQEIARFDCNSNQGGWGYNKTNGGDGFDSETVGKMSRQRVADGTHNFLDSEFQRESNRKRVEEGTHHFLGGDINRKRVEEGTHNFLGGEIQRKRIEEGTHNFLEREFREIQRKIARESNRKRVEEGTHNFLEGEITRESNRKRVEEGTHNLLRHNNPKARPEYMQVYWEFITLFPLGIKEARKHLYEKFDDIPKNTICYWTRKWQTELDNP